MSIKKAIRRAYETARSRNWDKIYWAIDLHETCIRSEYGQGSYKWLHDGVIHALRKIASRPETIIILWSSVHAEEEQAIINFFAQEGIRVSYFNHNPEVRNTAYGNFETKFYFNVLLDDKAGFDYNTDWYAIHDLFDMADFEQRRHGRPNPFDLKVAA